MHIVNDEWWGFFGNNKWYQFRNNTLMWIVG